LLFALCATCLHAFVGSDASSVASLQAQQVMSNQYSNLILEWQSVMAWSRIVSGWHAMISPSGQSQQYPSGNGLYGYEQQDLEQDFEEKDFDLENDLSVSRKAEAMSEQSMLMLLKYLHIICAKKLDASQAVHYQSKAVIATAQAAGASNPFMSQMLYLLYIRDFLQTIQTSQTLQRYDSWTLWNFLEIIETNEFSEGAALPPTLQLQLKTSAATAFRVFHTEVSIDLQLFFIDYYLAAMNQQVFAAQPVAQPASFIQEEVSEEAQPGKPFFPMMMMGNPQYMMYYTWMLKFYSKFIVFNAAQSLASAAQIELHHVSGVQTQDNQGFNGYGYGYQQQQNHGDSTQLKRYGLASLQQWVQIRYFLVYLDFISMYMGAFPQTTPQGHAAAAATNLVQTEAPEQVPAPQPEIVHEAPVIENQVPEPIAKQVANLVETRQSVVG
jgi:hypothetical protein